MSRPKSLPFAFQNYWNLRDCQRFQNVVNRAEAVEFIVRMAYYIYRVWEIIKANEKYRIWGLLYGIFPKNYSFEFADQLIDKLQVVFESHLT